MQVRIMGYARVSSFGQNLDRQIIELKKYVPEENIVIDKQSGKNLERPGYQALKGPLGLRRGDILYVKFYGFLICQQPCLLWKQGRNGFRIW